MGIRDKLNLSRRQLLGGTAVTVGTGALAANTLPLSAPAQAAGNVAVAPGDLDDYYGFWSSGQTGSLVVQCSTPNMIIGLTTSKVL